MAWIRWRQAPRRSHYAEALFSAHFCRSSSSSSTAGSTAGKHGSGPLLAAIAVGASAGAVSALAVLAFQGRLQGGLSEDLADRRWQLLEARRARLPERIILVRHGESEGNADHTLYRTKPDNLIELTAKGSQQALEAGKRIKQLIGSDPVIMEVSPFARTVQTARNIRQSFDDQVVRTNINPQIREQEFGNLQGDDFKSFRAEQEKVGRLYYRFPTGESGCDVYDRTSLWWEVFLKYVNTYPNLEHAKSVVVVTHGLTMRLILMQLHGWSPDTFHSVWNANNCDMYVLRKDVHRNTKSPYFLDHTEGDFPRSSAVVSVELKDGRHKFVKINDYLLIPEPHTLNWRIAAKMIEEQHGIPEDSIQSIDFSAGRFKKFM